MPRCAGKKADGTPCERIVGASQTLCYAHDGAFAEARKRAASAAARSKPDREVRALKGQLRAVADGVLSGAVEPKRGAVAVQALSALMRAIEQERKIRELEELADRLDELEDLVQKAQGTKIHAKW
jgi:uncharacterized protein YjiS (DUF1127 family)